MLEERFPEVPDIATVTSSSEVFIMVYFPGIVDKELVRIEEHFSFTEEEASCMDISRQ